MFWASLDFGFLMELDVIVGWIVKGGTINWRGHFPYVIQFLGVRLKYSVAPRTVYLDSSYVGVDINIFL